MTAADAKMGKILPSLSNGGKLQPNTAREAAAAAAAAAAARVAANAHGKRGPRTLAALLKAAADATGTLTVPKAPPERKDLAIQLLVQGRPQAFVDFFMLSADAGDAARLASPEEHTPAAAAAPPGMSAAPAAPKLSHTTLTQLKQSLMDADVAVRAGETVHAYAANAAMARAFTQLQALDRAAFFWKRCRMVRHSAPSVTQISASMAQAIDCVLGCLGFQKRKQYAHVHIPLPTGLRRCRLA
jgi:hypothetical protein